MQGLTKVHVVIEKSAMHVQKVALEGRVGGGRRDRHGRSERAQRDPDDRSGFPGDHGAETKIAKPLESLQEDKSPEDKKIDIISWKGTWKGPSRSSRRTLPFAAGEEVQGSLDETDDMAKAMHTYSRQPRTEVQAAFDAAGIAKAVDKFDAFDKVVWLRPNPTVTARQGLVASLAARSAGSRTRGGKIPKGTSRSLLNDAG